MVVDIALRDYVAYFCSNYLAHMSMEGYCVDLRLTDDEVLFSSLHHIDRELAELVDLDYPLHLCQQVELPRVSRVIAAATSGNISLLGNWTPVGAPIAAEQHFNIAIWKRLELVHETDSGEEPRIP